MILLHRLRGEPLYLNPDLVESVEASPDTLVTLTDGRRLVVAETPGQVAELARLYQASIAADAVQSRARLATAPGPTAGD